MTFISVAEELTKKSFTAVENKFITKYLPELDPVAVKVYLYGLYICQNNLKSYTQTDFANALNITEEQLLYFFKYLEEYELVIIINQSPLEVKILDCGNVYGTPKKYKPEKFADFTKSVQSIIKSRMISTNEYMEYFYLLEEYNFDKDALLMIITYCVSLKGDDIRAAYIKKVAKSFAAEGITTAKKVEDKLSAYINSTPSLINLFNAVGINRSPDVNDEKFYKKWTKELGFEDASIIFAAKQFKTKTIEKIDNALAELYKYKKFDVKEIEDYCKNKNSVLNSTVEIAKALGVYMQNPAPYIENFVNIWCNYGFEFSTLKAIANYCFLHNKGSFVDMDEFIKRLYDEGIVNFDGVNEYISALNERDNLIKSILSSCGLTRKIINWDIESLNKWKSWGFSNEMILEASKISAGKSNPMAYVNGVLSTWKKDGILSLSQLEEKSIKEPTYSSSKAIIDKSTIESHYADLRHKAEEKGEKIFERAMSDEVYGKLHKEINSLTIKLAFAEIRDAKSAEEIKKKIGNLTKKANMRLKELKINKLDFEPKYRCPICNDTGYDKDGKQCVCLKEFVSKFNNQ